MEWWGMLITEKTSLQKLNFKMKFQYDSPPQIPFLRGIAHLQKCGPGSWSGTTTISVGMAEGISTWTASARTGFVPSCWTTSTGAPSPRLQWTCSCYPLSSGLHGCPTAWRAEDQLGVERVRRSFTGRSAIAIAISQISQPYRFDLHEGDPHRPRPSSVFAVGITHQGVSEMAPMNAGQFLFEALRDLDIPLLNFLVDRDGRVYGADFRVWKAMNLTTLPNWPPTRALQAAGHDVSHGLHDGHITWALQVMLTLQPGHLKPMLITPRDALLLLTGSNVEKQLGGCLLKVWWQDHVHLSCSSALGSALGSTSCWRHSLALLRWTSR